MIELVGDRLRRSRH